MEEKTQLTEEEWRERLTPEQYEILRRKGTERAFTGAYWDEHSPGVYRCAGCGSELFRSDTKFESGSGWPSFYEPSTLDSVVTETDTSYGMTRTEVMCATCGGHLGHVFEDGPNPTGLRYCINSAALRFIHRDDLEAEGYGHYLSLFETANNSAQQTDSELTEPRR